MSKTIRPLILKEGDSFTIETIPSINVVIKNINIEEQKVEFEFESDKFVSVSFNTINDTNDTNKPSA